MIRGALPDPRFRHGKQSRATRDTVSDSGNNDADNIMKYGNK